MTRRSSHRSENPHGIEGLRIAEDFVSAEEETRLIALIEQSGLTYPPYDPGNRRSSTSYDWKYDFVNDTFLPCPPLPDGFRDLRCAAARFAGVKPDSIAECLLNRYQPGAVIQPHFDKPVWDLVIGISLGAAATMQFTRAADADPVEVKLRPRSAYLLSGAARSEFMHGLPAQAATRWSITFRTWSEEGLRLREASQAA